MLDELTRGIGFLLCLRNSMSSLLISILIVLVVAYSVWGWTLYFMQHGFLYRPIREINYTPNELGLAFEQVTFKTTDGLNLVGWYVPADTAELTVLFCHGNGGNITHRLDSINLFHEMGLNCLIFDYRGYGSSEGVPSEQGTYLDAHAAYEYLTMTRKLSPENIIIFGRSLGGSIAAHLATQVQPRALVIESAFTSYVDIGKKFYPYMPVCWFARFSYRTIDYIKNVRCPAMIIHSRNDETIPFEFGMELYQAANEPRHFVEIHGTHNDAFLVSAETYKNAWKNWLKSLTKTDTHSKSHQTG